MKLTDEQTKSVGRAYEAMLNIKEHAKNKGIKGSVMMIDPEGCLFIDFPGIYYNDSKFLNDLTNKTIAEIDAYEERVERMLDGKAAEAKARRMAELRKELEMLEA